MPTSCMLTALLLAPAAEVHPADWMRDGRLGAFMHFWPGRPQDLGVVDAFDVAAMARQCQEMGAAWLVLTLGQNSPCYNAPNAVYDRYLGVAPGERCARRDLPLALYEALHPLGIRLLLYLPCQVPNRDPAAQRAFGLPEGPKDQPIDEAFAHKWAEVIAEWAVRYGDKVAGWWFDGGYQHIHFNDAIAAIYAAAVRRGNPQALVTFNPGIKLVRATQAENYTAGELNEPFGTRPTGRFVDGSQWHALTYLGSNWGRRDTRYPVERWVAWVQAATAQGGAVTLDLGPNSNAAAGPVGTFSPEQVAQFRDLRRALTGGQAARPQPAVGGWATAAKLEDFLGEPRCTPRQELWTNRGGWGGVLTARDGTLLAFQSPGGGNLRRSHDGGATWEENRAIGPDANGGNALVDEVTGDLLYFNPGAGWLYRSSDSGATWRREELTVRPDGFGNIPRTEGVSAMQCGLTLAFGPHRGRLISPARVMGPHSSNANEWRPYHYSTAVYSDDGGRSWQTSQPFPVLGTGEGTLAELSDGRLLYNSREHMSRGNRYFAHSDDGGSLWLSPYRSPDLPDGARGTSYGLMGGMLRLPLPGHDILIYSNVDTAGGEMPKQVGASIVSGRERATVWASFDGGRTWPVKRLVYEGPSAYSNLGVGRSGTATAGRIFLLFEGGPGGPHAAVQFVSFNLSWLLDGRPLADLLPASTGR
ncbi:MAG: exo-alpha-sialidase [Fimbriimonadaceae bacterium]|nr:exo-alpha-sialidase [Fimbriimonadaceae bacterium]